MARFRLLQPHDLNTVNGPFRFEAGSEVESSDHPGFVCSALMEALDYPAELLLLDECDRLRLTRIPGETGCVPGIGPVQCLPY